MMLVYSFSVDHRETNLGDVEVGEHETASTSGSPEEEHFDPEASRAGSLVDQVGGGKTKSEVPEPVGGDGEGHGLGTDVKREDLTADNPTDGTPCGGEEGDIDADESDQNLLPRSVRGRNRNTDDADQKLAEGHPSGADQEQLPTTKPLDTPHTRESHEHVDDIDGDSDQERVMNTRVLEEHGAVVDDEVDTGEL